MASGHRFENQTASAVSPINADGWERLAYQPGVPWIDSSQSIVLEGKKSLYGRSVPGKIGLRETKVTPLALALRYLISRSEPPGLNPNVGIPFIPFILTRNSDAATWREFDTNEENPKLRVSTKPLIYSLKIGRLYDSAGTNMAFKIKQNRVQSAKIKRNLGSYWIMMGKRRNGPNVLYAHKLLAHHNKTKQKAMKNKFFVSIAFLYLFFALHKYKRE